MGKTAKALVITATVAVFLGLAYAAHKYYPNFFKKPAEQPK